MYEQSYTRHGTTYRKKHFVNNQCKIDLVGNGSRVVYFTTTKPYISIPKLWEDINIVYRPQRKWWIILKIISMHN
jgi:hypothetical protein